MFTVVLVCLGLLIVALAIVFGWRLASERAALPCPTWLAWLVEMDNPFTQTNRAGIIIQHLDLEPGMKVLDLGCGPGRLTIPLAQAVGPQGEVLAVDLQPGMLERARAKARAADLENIRFMQAAAGQGQLAGEQVDRALLVTVLGEIPNREAALKELFENLKPGGRLSVTEIVADPHFQRRETVLRLAEQAGFREQAFFGNGFAYTLNVEKPQA